MRSSFKKYVLGFLLFFVVLGGVLFYMVWPGRPRPLPFNEKVFISIVASNMFAPTASAPLLMRMEFSIFKSWREIGGTQAAWSFSPAPVRLCSVQGLLTECSEVNGGRYLVPQNVAAGIVTFGNTNVLNGPQWVAAFEGALQTNDVQIYDTKSRRPRPEHLVLLRFPAQKTIVVLPESEVKDFERTNGIQMPGADAK